VPDFFGGLWSFVRRLAPRAIAAPIVALAAAAFVAAGIASDAFSFGQMITLHAHDGVRPDANLAAIADVSSSLVLIEANVCLGVVLAAVSIVGLRRQALPAVLCWFGLVAAAASAVPGFAPTTEALFIVSNLLRLAFVVASRFLIDPVPISPVCRSRTCRLGVDLAPRRPGRARIDQWLTCSRSGSRCVATSSTSRAT
jgi:hypothetical protein